MKRIRNVNVVLSPLLASSCDRHKPYIHEADILKLHNHQALNLANSTCWSIHSYPLCYYLKTCAFLCGLFVHICVAIPTVSGPQNHVLYSWLYTCFSVAVSTLLLKAWNPFSKNVPENCILECPLNVRVSIIYSSKVLILYKFSVMCCSIP